MTEPTGVSTTSGVDEAEPTDLADGEFGEGGAPSEYTTESSQDAPGRAVSRRPVVTGNASGTGRRKVLVALTSQGRRAVDELLPQIVALQTAMVAGLSEAHRRQLLGPRRRRAAIRLSHASSLPSGPFWDATKPVLIRGR